MFLQFTSLNFMRNWQTRLVSLGLLPLVNLLLLVLINAQYHNRFNWPIAVASVVLSGGSLAMTGIAQLLVTDHMLGIDRIMLVKRPHSLTYWWGKLSAASISGGLLVIVSLMLLSLFGTPHLLIIRAMLMTPEALLIGSLLGWVSFIAAWTFINPYFYVNLISTFLTVTAGVLIPLNRYPTWLRVISTIFPFNHSLAFVRTGHGAWYLDLLCASGWLLLGIFLYTRQGHRLLHNPKKSW